jgi:Lon protease-like protein
VLVHDVLHDGGEFGVVLIERGSEVGGGDDRFTVGTLARVVRAVPLGGGRHAIEAVGTERFRVVRWLADDPYPLAEIEPVAEEPPGASTRAVRAAAERSLAEVVALCARLDPRLPDRAPPLAADDVRASYEIASFSPLGPLDVQRVLEAPGADERYALLDALLADAAATLRLRLGDVAG